MQKINDNALDLLQKRYFQNEEKSWDDLCKRVSLAIADAEESSELKEKWYGIYYDMMKNLEFIPSTPCLLNANIDKPGQLSSCFIIDLRDNIESIYQAKSECAKIFQKNGGVGFNISTLRPQGTAVETSKGYSCGTIGFMEEFDLTADVVTRNNIRKGAIKVDLNDWHPDIHKFINCKKDTNKLQFMNISVSLSDEFMRAVIDDKDWVLMFPDYSWNKEIYNTEWDGDIDGWINKGYPVRTYETLEARNLYKEIMQNAHATGEPGVSFRDIMDKDNPNPRLGKTNKTNPCGEFCSIPYNSCNLGSVNLLSKVKNGMMDSQSLIDSVSKAVRFLDNMITVNKLPITKINDITKSVRSIGLGVMGFADALYKLKIPYDSNEGFKFADNIFKLMSTTAKNQSVRLAEEKGVYDAWEGSIYSKSNIKIRNSNFLSIAPTGSISFIAGVSGGVEPNFALVYTRRTNEGDIYYIVNEVFEEELKTRGIYSESLLQKIADNHGSCVGISEVPEDMQKIFVTSHDISPKDHTKMIGIIQKHVDLSISKTVNLPSTATVEDVMDVYIDAWESGCKGITVYRDGSRDNQTLSASRKEETVELIVNSTLERGMILDVSDDVIGKKRKLMTGCGSLHCVALFDPITGDLVETYLSKGSQGGCNNFMVGLSRMISLAARGGIDIHSIVDQLKSSGTCPSYAVRKSTKNDTSKGSCCPVAIANVLLDMQQEMWNELGIIEDVITKEIIKNNPKIQTKSEDTGGKCPECGEDIVFEGGCNQCKSCGWSKCG